MADTPPVPRPKPRAKKSAGTTGSTPPTDSPTIEQPIPEPKPKPQAKTPRAGSLDQRLADFLMIASVPFAAVGDSYSAGIITQRVPALATNLSGLAKENPAVARALNRMMEGGAWGGVVLSAASILIPIMQSYGAIPGNDPFGMLYGGTPDGRPMKDRMGSPNPIAAPPAGFDGWSQQAPPESVIVPPPSAGGNPPAAVSVVNDDGTPSDIPVYQDGSPPGVVTVAGTAAGHSGARP